MATPYEEEKISAHDAAQISEHHPKHNTVATMDPERRKQVEKSLKRKLDARCSLFVLIYIMNCKRLNTVDASASYSKLNANPGLPDLDRNNIAAARLGGLEKDLGLTPTQYSTCLSILYVGYILMQVPSNMIINVIPRPSLYISVVMLVRKPWIRTKINPYPLPR
jgi:hypothetical protein